MWKRQSSVLIKTPQTHTSTASRYTNSSPLCISPSLLGPQDPKTRDRSSDTICNVRPYSPRYFGCQELYVNAYMFPNSQGMDVSRIRQMAVSGEWSCTRRLPMW